jgi:HD superfamily phosphohydrolase
VKPKLFRDPVHDIISFPKDTPEDRVLLALIDTPEVQRLRRIRQLGFTFLVYHGAEHSRFVHSMGVASVARRMAAVIDPQASPADRLAVVAAALCHDLGHGPFSHVTERIAHFHHEAVTVALVTTPGSGVFEVLSDYDPALPARVASFYDPAGHEPLRQLVSSQLDADRIDYILRDGLSTGVKIGMFDVQRILAMLELHDGVIAVSEGALEAVEGYLLARFHMYKQVYLHKASRAAERMLEAVMLRARMLDESGALGFPAALSSSATDGPLLRVIRGTIDKRHDIAALDDADIWYALKQWAVHSDSVLARLASGLLTRRLYKTVPIAFGPEGDAAIEAARRAARAMSLDPDFAVLVDSSEDTPYTPYVPDSPEPDESIRIARLDGRVVPIERHSEVVRLLGRIHYRVRRMVLPPELTVRLNPPDTRTYDELEQPELPLGP